MYELYYTLKKITRRPQANINKTKGKKIDSSGKAIAY